MSILKSGRNGNTKRMHGVQKTSQAQSYTFSVRARFSTQEMGCVQRHIGRGWGPWQTDSPSYEAALSTYKYKAALLKCITSTLPYDKKPALMFSRHRMPVTMHMCS